MKVQGGESLELEPDKFLWGHFEMRDLARRGRQDSKEDPDPEGRVTQAVPEQVFFCLTPLTHTKGEAARETWGPSPWEHTTR